MDPQNFDDSMIKMESLDSYQTVTSEQMARTLSDTTVDSGYYSTVDETSFVPYLDNFAGMSTQQDQTFSSPPYHNVYQQLLDEQDPMQTWGYLQDASSWPDYSAEAEAHSTAFDTNIETSTPQPVASQTPSKGKGSKGKVSHGREFSCHYPQCPTKSFSRPADLQRHYDHVHKAAQDSQTGHCCDYPKCPRKTQPFGRKDHFRDHLREYHREDILKRGGQESAEWFQERNINDNIWRCGRCLRQNKIAKCGWVCPTCKLTCEMLRINHRLQRG